MYVKAHLISFIYLLKQIYTLKMKSCPEKSKIYNGDACKKDLHNAVVAFAM